MIIIGKSLFHNISSVSVSDKFSEICLSGKNRAFSLTYASIYANLLKQKKVLT